LGHSDPILVDFLSSRLSANRANVVATLWQQRTSFAPPINPPRRASTLGRRWSVGKAQYFFPFSCCFEVYIVVIVNDEIDDNEAPMDL